jgi:two-component system, chemotaxis family, CheB/CheR fusion protein
MRRLIFFHSSPMTSAEEALLGAVQAEDEWQTSTFTEETPISEVSAKTTLDGEISAALLSGSLRAPAQLARALRRIYPNCLILFVADAQQFGAVRRQLGVAPMLGPNWKLVPADIAEIQQALSQSQETTGRQQRVRTTPQRMGERLAAPSLRTETRFHRQMLSERYLVSVLSHGFDAVVCFNERRQVIAWNAAAESLFELPHAAALGRELHELGATSPLLSQILPSVRAAFEGESLQRFEREITTADGSSCFFEMMIAAVAENEAAPGVVLVARDITDRRRAQEQVRREREWLQTTLASIGDAVIATDSEGRVAFMNPIAERLTGWTAAEAHGQRLERIFVIVNEETRATVENPVEKALRLGAIVGLANHTLLISRSGVEHPIDDSAAPIRLSEKLHGVVLVFRDVTERRAAEREIIAARDEAERATKAKDQFLAVLSHELRTPLTPVVMLLDSLRTRSELPADVRSDLQLIQRNVMMEARLVDDLLDINRISQGKLQLQVELVDIHRTLEFAENICHAQASEKSIRVVTEFRAPNPHVCGDLSRLQQVFWNLIQNAVKFTPPHGTVTITTASGGDDWIVISVADTGVGITADVLPKVFDAFEQGTTAVTRQFGGLGLGLAISRALVDAHGGVISATSRGLNQGATFSVHLKSATEAECAAAPTPAAAFSARKQRLRILLVEDHEDTRTTLQRLLTRRGHHVFAARTIAEAVSIGSREPIDLLVSDIGLPDGSGTDLMRSLRTGHPGIKGIALSGFGLEEDVDASIRAGFAEHLTKPLNLQQLEDAIERLVTTD